MWNLKNFKKNLKFKKIWNIKKFEIEKKLKLKKI